ncbi:MULTISPECIES: subtilosin maturase AlbA [Bacillus]|uniref:subtilosin maturase AlbA n=1 Tax=Bacillus TaxID=1386 RepID=UPI00065E7265|nr:subtilosin maturase AlbA [Bacillus smithii]AKP46488.1 Radical SAM domain heme biosynthesis protein [Bacillus smithii]MED4884644.1 subtilosin maturase AlbA [Bacillus smithii]MED4928342.1 subtilosin maturase AlbA [Bacillus smithii]
MALKNKYPYIGDHIRIHKLPSGGVLEIDYLREDVSASDFEYLDLNQTAYEICMRMDGTKTIEEILQAQCDKYNENIHDHEGWYYDMIHMLLKKQVIKIMDQAKYKLIQVSGSNEYPMPLHATFELTHKCNLKCEHCYLESSPQAQGTISLEKFKKVTDMLYKNGVLTCEITGGEVFVHPKANEILAYALNKFKKVAILTNGTLLRKESADLLIKYKHKIIVGISLDSVRPEVHNRFRGKKHAFEQTCKTIKLLSDNGIFVRVAMSVFEDNMWEIREMASLVKELGAKLFTYNWVNDFGRGKNIELPTVNANVYQKFLSYEKELLEEFKDLIPIIPYERKRVSNCGAGWRSIVVDPYGNVRPCALFPKTFSLGNILTDSYENIFKSPIVHKLWKLQSPKFSEHCKKGCPFNGYCGGCYLKGLNANKHHRTNTCSWAKNENLEDILQLV